jgi:DNA-binding transcriptional MerR regulator
MDKNKLEGVIDSQSLNNIDDLYDVLSQEKLSVRDTGISARVLSHWNDKGMIRFSREHAESNRKFSFVDFIWLKVVTELRSFGVQLSVIKKITDNIYEQVPLMELLKNYAFYLDSAKKYKDRPEKDEFVNFFKSGDYKKSGMEHSLFQMNYLHLLITDAISSNKQISLIVFNDGEWFPYIKDTERTYSSELLYKKDSQSQIRVNLTELIFKYVLEDCLHDYVNRIQLFTFQENRLLHFIREKNYKKVFVFFKSKKREALEIVNNTSSQQKIIRILREKEYREFIVIDQDNNEVRIRETLSDQEAEPKTKPS